MRRIHITAQESAKRAATVQDSGELITMMRRVVRKHPTVSQADIVALWRKELHAHEDKEFLQEAAETYCGYNLYRRVLNTNSRSAQKTKTVTKKQKEIAVKVKQVVEAGLLLWNMRLATTGRSLHESTFYEVSEAAAPTNKFLIKLAAQGAPGARVSDVFKTRASLQEFWDEVHGNPKKE